VFSSKKTLSIIIALPNMFLINVLGYKKTKTCFSIKKKLKTWEKMASENEEAGELSLNLLPEGCIANVLSFTSPLAACRLSIVSPLFRSAAETDALWERFLPRDHQSILSES
jgi:hypothetical protein